MLQSQDSRDYAGLAGSTIRPRETRNDPRLSEFTGSTIIAFILIFSCGTAWFELRRSAISPNDRMNREQSKRSRFIQLSCPGSLIQLKSNGAVADFGRCEETNERILPILSYCCNES